MPSLSCDLRPSALAAKNSFAPLTNFDRRCLFVTISLAALRARRLPVSAAAIHRSAWLDCVALRIVMWPVSGSTSTMLPRVSIGWFDCRGHDRRSVITRSAAAKIASTSEVVAASPAASVNVSTWS